MSYTFFNVISFLWYFLAIALFIALISQIFRTIKLILIILNNIQTVFSANYEV